MSDVHYEFSAVCLSAGMIAPGMPMTETNMPEMTRSGPGQPGAGSSGKVALFVTVKGLLPSDIAAQANVIRRDVLQCFSDSGFAEVSEILSTLPYQWAGSDTLTFHGAVSLRQQIFQRLSTHDLDPDLHGPDTVSRELTSDFRSMRDDTCGPDVTRPDVTRSVSVEFFRSRSAPHLTVHVHHGAMQSWAVNDMPPPPVLPSVVLPSLKTNSSGKMTHSRKKH